MSSNLGIWHLLVPFGQVYLKALSKIPNSMKISELNEK